MQGSIAQYCALLKRWKCKELKGIDSVCVFLFPFLRYSLRELRLS